MTIWSTYCSYQYPFSTLSDFTFNNLAYSNLFSMPAFPRYSVFDNNIFGFTPSTNFCALSQNTYSQQYLAPINLTNPFMTYDFQPRIQNDSIFGFLNLQNTVPVLTDTNFSSNKMFSFLNLTANRNSYSSAPSDVSVTSSYSRTSFNTSSSCPALRNVGYNPTKGNRLASAINSTSPHKWGDELCATHVKDAIQDAGLGPRESGHASDMIAQLGNNPNFKEISTAGLNLSQLPAGCVLVYDKGVADYSSQYGHTEITLGNGQALSSGVTQNIRAGARVFVPV